MGRDWLNGSRLLVLCAALLGIAAVGVVALALSGGGDDGDGGGDGGGRAGDGAASTAPEESGPPAPKRPARLGPAPAAVPAVRDWRPVRGPGWRPDDGGRVVADADGSLADEARLLARELRMPYAEGPARNGDVELRTVDDPATPREAYVLTSRDGRVRITGSSDAGVFYGTRTLLQTVRARGGFADGVVRDRPDRPQRGFMLDIARKHFDADWIEDRVRELGDLKLNQLQLHLSDDQAFRVESDSHPEIVSKPHLTKREVRDIVRLAASRHITVIPEIDSPGHLGAVLRAHPDLQLRNASGARVQGAVDIANPKAGKLVDELLAEYAELFPGPYWHLGGDEYRALMAEDPGAAYPKLAAAARERHGADAGVTDLATAWLNDRAAAVRKHGKTPQVWNDGMHRGGEVKPSEQRQVAYWTGKEIGERQPEEYLKEGWRLINLNDEYLYYVLGEPNDFTYPTGERIYERWTPAVVRGTGSVPDALAGPDRILGGRFAVWCDLSDAQTTAQVAKGIRMPLRATAQKLWDPRDPELSWADFRALADQVD
ncbi:glycoside hydrolase family 20 protein [Streptomyces sp. Z26]|uniref:beta-N-acetylhexosaminidase n=1 Tax=Streptomyces sp. Z26 TaxID=2500177 RepID=UPI000EF15018|nr:glycoside hydrolase family 20 protein [Streptomyces sp. Z26]RLL68551.1 beta-N-acetylglucosaminidase [Streptomyces sp. Z26]